ncbi:MAG: GntR family transcriptional regulator [Shinella sp.]|nr:GntR family transcriptional regulator [Shinella sp.]
MAEQEAPLYLRIAERLAGDIQSGRLKVGEKIASERVLAGELGVSRMTARQAVQHLTSRGLLEARVGQGTFVTHAVIEQKLSTLTGFTEEMARQGHKSSSIVVLQETRKADNLAAEALKLPVNGLVHRLVRVRLVDGEPVAIETTDVSAALAPGLIDLADFGRESLYHILRENFGIAPTTGEQTMMAATADARTAGSLAIEEGSPVLKLTRLTFDSRQRPFEFVRSFYRGDSFVMKVDLNLGVHSSQ